jgi:hypothetical protein
MFKVGQSNRGSVAARVAASLVAIVAMGSAPTL